MIANTPTRVSASASFGRSNLQREDGAVLVGERGSGGAGSVAGSGVAPGGRATGEHTPCLRAAVTVVAKHGGQQPPFAPLRL